MNPNVCASYALFSRLAAHGVTHCVLSPGSRSTPLAYVANQLFDTTVVIDERDAGFVALGIAESTGRAPVVITTSGSAPTHLYPSVVEAFHSNIALIVISADRPHEVRGRGAAQTIDQVNMFNTSVRYFFDALCPHDESSTEYWEEQADALFEHSSGGGVHGPVHLNMGMREPLVPDGDEGRPSPTTEIKKTTATYSSQLDRRLLSSAETVVVTLGRNAGVDEDSMVFLMENFIWPQLSDVTSNVRFFPTTITSYDAIMRRSDAKNFIPDLIIQIGDPLTSKIWNEMTSASQIISVTRYDDGRDPHGNISQHIVARDINKFLRQLATIHHEPSCSFFDEWKLADTQALQTINHVLDDHDNSEPALFAELGVVLNNAPQANVLIASSMPIRYAEWLWIRPSSNLTLYSHRGTNGIDGMVSSAYGIAHGSSLPTLCVTGDVAFAHDIGFLSALSQLCESNNECVIYFVVDNGGGAIFRHIGEAHAASLDDSYEKLYQTKPAVDIKAMAGACGAHYVSGSNEECVNAVKDILEKKIAGVHVIHAKVDHDSGTAFMKALRDALAGPTS